MMSATVFELAAQARKHYTTTEFINDNGDRVHLTHLQSVDGSQPQQWMKTLHQVVQTGEDRDDWRSQQIVLALDMIAYGEQQLLPLNTLQEMFYLQAEPRFGALQDWAMSSYERQQRCSEILSSYSQLQEAYAEEKVEVFQLVKDVLLAVAGLSVVSFDN